MKHLDDGILRRMVDEPQHIPEASRQHYADCPHCQDRFAEIAETAQVAARLLQDRQMEQPLRSAQVNTSLALARVRQRLAASEAAAQPMWYERILASMSTNLQLNRQRLLKPLAGAATVAALAAAVALTPLGSYAQNVLNLFTPQQFVAVPVSRDALKTLPNLSDYGTVSETQRNELKRVNNVTEAAASAGFKVLSPAQLPAGVTGAPSYRVLSGNSATFTFSAAKAQAAAAAKGKALPAMPANVDGSSLHVTTYPAVIATYGSQQIAIPDGVKQEVSAVRGKTGDGAKPGPASDAQVPESATVPQLLIAQAKAPQVTSTGVTVPELEQYLLSQPGIDPSLAAAIRGIADPNSTLPIPIPVDKANSHPVSVQNANGLAIGDATGLGSVVIWEKDGVIYAVGGALKEAEVLAVANSLH